MSRHTLALSLALSLTLLIPSSSSSATAARDLSRNPAAAECEGGACQHVAVTFDEAKAQYRVQNNSGDRWIKVAASNVTAYASICVGPGKVEYLPLKSIVGSYKATYSESACGA